MMKRRRTDDTSSSISNFLILAFGQLNQQLCDLVLDFHLTENRCAVIGDCYFAVW